MNHIVNQKFLNMRVAFITKMLKALSIYEIDHDLILDAYAPDGKSFYKLCWESKNGGQNSLWFSNQRWSNKEMETTINV